MAVTFIFPVVALVDEVTPCALDALQANAPCEHCVTSPTLSRASIRAGDGLAIEIQSVAVGCRRKRAGGDAWVVQFESDASAWRVLARHEGDGRYLADVSHAREELKLGNVSAWPQRWWSALDADYLEVGWRQ